MNRSTKPQSGNAFVITLVSVVLLGALTFVLTRQMGATVPDRLSEEKAALYAERIIGQANAMEMALIQMQQTGVAVESLDFDLPSSGTFNTGNTAAKVFHPGGGGVNYPPTPLAGSEFYKLSLSNIGGMASTTQMAWGYMKGKNVEWTPTTATDIIYSIWGMSDAICQAINKKLTGSTTLPAISGNISPVFRYATSGNIDFLATQCPGCSGQKMLCVQKSADSLNAFYAVVLGR